MRRKRNGFIRSINETKSSLAYKNCPPSIRPQTPKFDGENAQTLSKEWALAVTSLVPRNFKPLKMVKEDDIANVMQSQLFKDYLETEKGKNNKIGCQTHSTRYRKYSIRPTS